MMDISEAVQILGQALDPDVDPWRGPELEGIEWEALRVLVAHVQREESAGVKYCITHAGVVNEDDDGPCDFWIDLEGDCQLVEAYYRPPVSTPTKEDR